MGQRIERKLPCRLTEEEMQQTAKDLAVNISQYNELEQEAKDVATTYRERLKLLDTLQRNFARMIETEHEERPVVCAWDYHNPERNKMTLIRQDSFEVVEVRDMSVYDQEAYAAEMQPKLFTETE